MIDVLAEEEDLPLSFLVSVLFFSAADTGIRATAAESSTDVIIQIIFFILSNHSFAK